MRSRESGGALQWGRCANGSALVVVLVFLMMLLVLVTVFLGVMRDAQHTVAWRNQFLSNSALNEYSGTLLVDALREEMRLLSDVSTTSVGTAWLEPVFPEDRRAAQLLPPRLEGRKDLQTLLRVSHPDPALALPGGLIAGPSTLDEGAGAGSGVSPEALHEPVLLDPRADFLPEDVHWIFLTRTGPITPQVLEPQHRMGSGAPEEIVGRIAYVIYDLSGKLDANASGTGTAGGGFAASAAGAGVEEPRTLASRKGSLRFLQAAEVEGLQGGGADSTVTVPTEFGYDLPALLASRSAAGPVRVSVQGDTLNPSPADYAGWLEQTHTFEAAGQGIFFQAGSQFVLSRQDLLHQAEQPATRIDPAGLARLSTFSRAAASVDGVPGAVPFPLRALDLPAFDFPANTADDPERQELIRRYFGLARASDDQPWQYVEQTSVEPGEIFQTPAEITDRAPNLFETLKAALLPGSLGQFTHKTAADEAPEWDQIADLQILKIGVNLIDQWDADSYPTLVELQHASLPDPALQVAGLENLPLVHQLHLDALNPLWGAADGEVPVGQRRVLPYLIPELWNPHKPALGGATGPGPQKIRLRLLGSLEIGLPEAMVIGGAPREDPVSLVAQFADNGSLVLDAAEFPTFSPVPRVIRNGQASGIFDNSGLTWQGQALPGLSSSMGRLPGTDFFAARITRDATLRDVYDACLSAAPLPRDFEPLGRVPGAERELFTFSADEFRDPPYPGMVVNESRIWDWEDRFQDRKLLEVQLNSTHRLDVLLEFQDHRGNWQPYSRFAHQNLAGTGGGIGLTADWRSQTLRLFDAALLNCEPDHPLIRRYLDTSGAVTFLKADPRTPRLGVAFVTDRLRGELPLVGFAAGGQFTGGSPRWRDEPLQPADLHYLSPSANERQYGIKVRLPAIEDPQVRSRELLQSTTAGPPILAQLFDDYYPALLAGNAPLPDGTAPPTLVRDPDGQIRPADGALLQELRSRVGLGSRTAAAPSPDANGLFTNQAGFSQVLNRPFQSITELGQVFRDQPWKTLDLTSHNSADSSVLEWFTLDGAVMAQTGATGTPPMRGGVLDLQRAEPDVLRALLLGTEQAPRELIFSFPVSPLRDQRRANVVTNRTAEVLDAVLLDETVADEMAGNLHDRLKAEPGLNTNQALAALYPASTEVPPALSARSAQARSDRSRESSMLSEGARTRDSRAGFPNLSGGSPQANPALKAQREAALKALADVAQSNSWNLFIDLFVQTGGYTRAAEDWADFQVRSRSRTWHRVAIHRETAQVLEHQRERVR